MIPQLFVLTIIVFALGKAMPGDPFTGLITPETKAEAIEELRIKAGFYDPYPVQYWNWIRKALKLDFGKSYLYSISVKDLIGQRVNNTFALSLLTTIFLYLIAVPLGIIAGRYNNSTADKVLLPITLSVMCHPDLYFRTIFPVLFGFKWGLAPTNGSVEPGLPPGTWTYVKSRFQHMWLPAITYAVLATTGTIQYLRNEIIDAKTSDYVKTARSKGVPIGKVYTRHIFRNSLLPIAAFFGFTITGLLGGSVFIETIFAYPGMGKLFIESINGNDYSTIMTLTLLYGFLNLLGSLLSDIIMTIVDPRIRIE